MNTNTQLATISPQEWPIVLEQAKMLCKTGFLPKAVDTPEKAIAIMMKGRELGIPPMYALSNIAVIQGKPAANAELMLALIYRDHGDQAIEFVETSPTRCTIQYKRRNARTYKSLTYTIEEARNAKLGGDNWQKYPAAMLRARCISAVARIGFADTIGGMHTLEELGVQADQETGEIITLPASAELPERIDVTPQEAEPDDLGLTDRFLAAWRSLHEFGYTDLQLKAQYKVATGTTVKFATLSIPDKRTAVDHLEGMVENAIAEAATASVSEPDDSEVAF